MYAQPQSNQHLKQFNQWLEVLATPLTPKQFNFWHKKADELLGKVFSRSDEKNLPQTENQQS